MMFDLYQESFQEVKVEVFSMTCLPNTVNTIDCFWFFLH